jgi:RNA polymerase sigma factor (sigma-70 family)
MNFRNLRSSALRAFSDAQLIESFRHSGDTRYMVELFGRYFPVIASICARYAPDPYDLIMRVFEKALKHLRNSPIHDFKPWIFKLSVHECISWERQQRRFTTKEACWLKIAAENIRREEQVAFDSLFEEKADPEPLVRIALEKLTEPQRRCIQLFFYEGKTYKEISQITGMENARVKSHLQNGKSRLRRILIKLDKSERGGNKKAAPCRARPLANNKS